MSTMFPIQSETAKKVWNNFERELVHKLKRLPDEEAADIKLEILSHLYDATTNAVATADETTNEEVRLINAISNLGSPDEYLEPLISDVLLYQNTAKGHPTAILKGLKNSAKKGVMHALATLVLGMGYFWIIMIFIMSVMHIFNPDVGIWYYSTGNFSLSFNAQPDAVQWMPKWFSLIGIVSSAFAYWCLSKLLSVLIPRIK